MSSTNLDWLIKEDWKPGDWRDCPGLKLITPEDFLSGEVGQGDRIFWRRIPREEKEEEAELKTVMWHPRDNAHPRLGSGKVEDWALWARISFRACNLHFSLEDGDEEGVWRLTRNVPGSDQHYEAYFKAMVVCFSEQS